MESHWARGGKIKNFKGEDRFESKFGIFGSIPCFQKFYFPPIRKKLGSASKSVAPFLRAKLIATGTPPPTINYAFSSVRASSLDKSERRCVV